MAELTAEGILALEEWIWSSLDSEGKTQTSIAVRSRFSSHLHISEQLGTAPLFTYKVSDSLVFSLLHVVFPQFHLFLYTFVDVEVCVCNNKSFWNVRLKQLLTLHWETMLFRSHLSVILFFFFFFYPCMFPTCILIAKCSLYNVHRPLAVVHCSSSRGSQRVGYKRVKKEMLRLPEDTWVEMGPPRAFKFTVLCAPHFDLTHGNFDFTCEWCFSLKM